MVSSASASSAERVPLVVGGAAAMASRAVSSSAGLIRGGAKRGPQPAVGNAPSRATAADQRKLDRTVRLLERIARRAALGLAPSLAHLPPTTPPRPQSSADNRSASRRVAAGGQGEPHRHRRGRCRRADRVSGRRISSCPSGRTPAYRRSRAGQTTRWGSGPSTGAASASRTAVCPERPSCCPARGGSGAGWSRDRPARRVPRRHLTHRGVPSPSNMRWYRRALANAFTNPGRRTSRQ
jgi:hypothetical protein